jgi:uncharacterized membrane protein
MDLYKILIESKHHDSVSIDQGFKSLLFSLEKTMMGVSKNEKEYTKLLGDQHQLKNDISKWENKIEKIKIEDKKHINEIKKYNWIANLQVIVILALLSAVIISVFKM